LYETKRIELGAFDLEGSLARPCSTVSIMFDNCLEAAKVLWESSQPSGI
jgi:hypothetical protein